MDKTKPPLVSVIVPAYNVAEYIGDALNSVLAQTFTDHEIIVINDGSPDTEALEKVLAPYMSRIVYLKQENRGVSAARNTGIKAARGSLIAFLDGDDSWLPHYLEVQVPRIQADPTIDVLYPNVVMFGDSSEAGEEFMTICPSNGEVTFERLLLQECNVSNCSIARRETILRAGLFDESLRSVEDFDLFSQTTAIVKKAPPKKDEPDPLIKKGASAPCSGCRCSASPASGFAARHDRVDPRRHPRHATTMAS